VAGCATADSPPGPSPGQSWPKKCHFLARATCFSAVCANASHGRATLAYLRLTRSHLEKLPGAISFNGRNDK
jgi:hypothetical protein